MTTTRDNPFRIAQKTYAAGTHHRRHERLLVPCRTSYYYQASRNRLFICSCAEQGAELRKLCGAEIRCINEIKVAFRRIHDPFAEEIALPKYA